MEATATKKQRLLTSSFKRRKENMMKKESGLGLIPLVDIDPDEEETILQALDLIGNDYKSACKKARIDACREIDKTVKKVASMEIKIPFDRNHRQGIIVHLGKVLIKEIEAIIERKTQAVPLQIEVHCDDEKISRQGSAYCLDSERDEENKRLGTLGA